MKTYPKYRYMDSPRLRILRYIGNYRKVRFMTGERKFETKVIHKDSIWRSINA